MIRYVVLDSSPLSMVTQRSGIAVADDCKRWLAGHVAAGVRAVVPEIVDYELRRELVRSGKLASVARLDQLLREPTTTHLPLTTAAMHKAAHVWADARRRGTPTAHADALDIDVILAAQVLSAGWPAGEFIVATSNVKHLARFVPAAEWSAIS